jgi:hypothetical protein
MPPTEYRAPRLLCLSFFLLLSLPNLLRAQAGPPMVTDDPGTPGDGHYEINIAVLSDGHAYELPLIDFNYGVGDRVQLKLETPYEVETQPSRRTGLGNGLAGVKWRFFDQGDDGWQISTYPQIQFVYPTSSSAKRGLAEPGTNLLLPVEIQRNVGGFEVGFETGRWLRQNDDDSWIVGLVVGKPLSERLETMAEIHDEESIGSSRRELLANVGARLKLSDTFVLLLSIGRDLHNSIDDTNNVISYLGLQILL